ERLGHRVIGIVAEAPVLPERVGRSLLATRPAPASAERGNVLVADLRRGERLRQCLGVELWPGAGAGQPPHIGDEADPRGPQELDELLYAAVRMADGEIVLRHWRPPSRLWQAE